MRAALAAFALLALCGAARAQADPPQISVTGEATISVVPDLATIDAGVTTDGKTAQLASDANNAAMGKVLLALRGAGIDNKDLQTQQASVQPNEIFKSGDGSSKIVNYRAANRVAITLRDTSRVGSVIDIAVGAGANEIGGISFSVSRPSQRLDDARMQAVADARRKADIYAKSLGVELGAPLILSEQGGPAPPMYRRVAAGLAAAATPVAQGEETLRVSVSVSWAIKNKTPQ